MRLISQEHGKRLPVIRIQKIVLKDFKSVEHGEIIFDCGKHFVPYGTQADVLGVYGQNGSGKTSLVEALSILKQLMIGYNVQDQYVNCISVKAPYSQLEYTFELQYEDGRVRKVVYYFKIEAIKKTSSKTQESSDRFMSFVETVMDSEYQMRIFDEVIQMSGDFYGEKIKLQPIIDTTTDDVKTPFLPISKRKYFLGEETEDILMNQVVNKRMASKSSQSYVFMDETILSFLTLAGESEYVDVITELRLYALKYLYVVDTKYIGAISNDIALALYSNNQSSDSAYNMLTDIILEEADMSDKEDIDKLLEKGGVPTILPMYSSFVLDKNMYERIRGQFESMNIVIGQLIPGMQVGIKLITDTLTKTGQEGKVVELITIRDDVEMPLRYESDGVKKIISVLDLIIRAYNQKSTTIAIDEFDSGIFEYLLGEILETFQEGGRGQFIFTSHNLRPLEVVDKKYLYFTTTDPKNRYVHIKNIGKTNNLRKQYYREIDIGEQDVELYRKTQKYKIATALRKAGRMNG